MKTSRLAFMALMSVSIMACSSQNFSSSGATGAGSSGNTGGGTVPGTTPGDATGTIRQDCQNDLAQSTIPIKLLFVVDTSGSNVNNSANPGGSDPIKAMRAGSIQEFFNLYRLKPNFSWALNTFSGSSSKALIGSSSSNPMFTNNPATMQSAIYAFLNVTDDGNTPYVAALDLANKAITNDTLRTQQTKWVVVFLSDGLPNPQVAQSTLNSKVSGITGLVPGQVTFNTVYYGAYNPTASSRLATMAQVGGGKFLDTNLNPAGKSFQILDVINVPGTACQ